MQKYARKCKLKMIKKKLYPVTNLMSIRKMLAYTIAFADKNVHNRYVVK